MTDVLCNLISFLIACDVACDAMSRMSSWSRQKQQLLYYNKYYDEGKEIKKEYKEYTSHNTRRLEVPEIKDILKNLDFIKKYL